MYGLRIYGFRCVIPCLIPAILDPGFRLWGLRARILQIKETAGGEFRVYRASIRPL